MNSIIGISQSLQLRPAVADVREGKTGGQTDGIDLLGLSTSNYQQPIVDSSINTLARLV
jgi:hypothetical protein